MQNEYFFMMNLDNAFQVHNFFHETDTSTSATDVSLINTYLVLTYILFTTLLIIKNNKLITYRITW